MIWWAVQCAGRLVQAPQEPEAPLKPSDEERRQITRYLDAMTAEELALFEAELSSSLSGGNVERLRIQGSFERIHFSSSPVLLTAIILTAPSPSLN